MKVRAVDGEERFRVLDAVVRGKGQRLVTSSPTDGKSTQFIRREIKGCRRVLELACRRVLRTARQKNFRTRQHHGRCRHNGMISKGGGKARNLFRKFDRKKPRAWEMRGGISGLRLKAFGLKKCVANQV